MVTVFASFYPKKDKTEEVKETINILKEKKIEQAENFKYDFRLVNLRH